MVGLGTATALVSMWVSNTATTAMMLPIGLGLLQAMHATRGAAGNESLRDWPYATGMMLLIAFAASIGGIGTPVGSPTNFISIGLIRSLARVEISFLRWMALAVPMVFVMAAALFLLLRVLHPAGAIGRSDSGNLRQYLAQERAALGKWTRAQFNTLAAFALAVTLWTLPGFLSIALPKGHPLLEFFQSRLPESVAALAAAGLLFVLPINLRQGRFTLTWEDAVQIDWGVVLLFGGGMSLGTLMFQTGVADAMAHGITGFTGSGSLWTVTAAAIAIGIVVSETTSNAASANMVIPVVIALAQTAGVNPVAPALGACFGASFGFMLPVSTPPNAIVYGSGLVPISKMMRAGIVFDVLGFFTILVMLRILGPLLRLC
jgi:sodium-dependent dicarboxylate transporter 2/3/5